jgi:NodT family efflux transporter outer membrane factor (OMF) lipoprotein
VAICVAATLLAGCMIGPDFKAPAVDVSDRWKASGQAEVQVAQMQRADWWGALNDPALSRLVDIAFRQNLNLQAAGVRVLQSRAQLGIAIGDFYPQQQQAVASLYRSRMSTSAPYQVVNPNYWSANYGLQAGWELDVWGKIRRGVESAGNAYLSSVAAYDDVLVTLIGDVASIYVQIRTLEARTRIANDNIVRQTQALGIARARFEGGVVTKRDVYQAEYALATTQSSIPELAIERGKAVDALCVLLGMAPSSLDSLIGGVSAIPSAPDSLLVGIPADLLRRRPDVRQAELNAAAQSAQIGLAKAALLPSFTLSGSIGIQSSTIGQSSLGVGSLTYTLGPGITWNILNYGQITNNVRVQDAKLQEQLINYQNTVLNAQKEVEDGILQFTQSRIQADFLQKSLTAANGSLRIALLQYQEGTADFTTVLTAEENLLKAGNSLAVAQGNIPLGLIQTYRAMGGGWEFLQGQDRVAQKVKDEMAQRTDWGPLLKPEGGAWPPVRGLPAPGDVTPLIRPPEW